MQTYSHFVLTALISRTIKNKPGLAESVSGSASRSSEPLQFGRWRLPPLRSRALLIGSVMPDVPLTLLGVTFILYDRFNGAAAGFNNAGATGHLFNYMFFHEPWVMALHNLFHAPLLTLFYTLGGFWLWRRQNQWGAAIFWFGVSCMLHTAIDIPLHYDDGPLLLFPFNWTLRFHSPLSYWDPRRYGIQFAIFEHLLLLAMLVYLGADAYRRRRARKVTAQET